jgi:uncharacterized protein (TIGR03000 family)
MIRKAYIRGGKLVLGIAAILATTRQSTLANGLHAAPGYHGGGGVYHGPNPGGFHHGGCPGGFYHGCWGYRGCGYYPFGFGVGLGLGLGLGYGYYPGWYGYPYYDPYLYPYGYPGAVPPGPFIASAGGAAASAPVNVTVRVPADADVWFNGALTQQKGASRQFTTAPISADQPYRYEIRAAWEVDGRRVTQTRVVAVHAGENVYVDFLAPRPGAPLDPAAAPPAPGPWIATPAPGSRSAPPTAVDAFSSPAEQTDRIDQALKRLSGADEDDRLKAVMELGRMQVGRAVDPLIGVLSGDTAPTVRDAAARALGLIADPRSLPALIRAAQADDDRDVRHSAQFAVEIIRSHAQK